MSIVAVIIPNKESGHLEISYCVVSICIFFLYRYLLCCIMPFSENVLEEQVVHEKQYLFHS